MKSNFPSGVLVLLVLGGSLSLWAYMIWGSLAHLTALAGGVPAFDVRPLGYGFDEAQALLAALGNEGRRYYLERQLALDTAYPATYALSRGLIVLWFARPGRVSQTGLSERFVLALLLLPLAAAAFDYWENVGIAAMLQAAPEVTPDLVARASAATIAKSSLSLATEGTVLVLIAVSVWRRLTSGRGGSIV